KYRLRYEYNQKIFYVSLNLEDAVSKDVISRYRTVDSSGVSTTTYINLKNRKRHAADLNAGIHYFKSFFNKTANLNINSGFGLSAYSMKSDDKHVSKDFRNVSGFTGNFKLYSAFKYKFITLSVHG